MHMVLYLWPTVSFFYVALLWRLSVLDSRDPDLLLISMHPYITNSVCYNISMKEKNHEKIEKVTYERNCRHFWEETITKKCYSVALLKSYWTPVGRVLLAWEIVKYLRKMRLKYFAGFCE